MTTPTPSEPDLTQRGRIAWSIVFLGAVAAIVIWLLAAVVAPWNPLFISAAGFAIAGIGLLIAAKPDAGVNWWELGKRSRRTWCAFALSAASFVLAVASVITALTA